MTYITVSIAKYSDLASLLKFAERPRYPIHLFKKLCFLRTDSVSMCLIMRLCGELVRHIGRHKCFISLYNTAYYQREYFLQWSKVQNSGSFALAIF